jgi:hypothetical protein
VIVNTGKNWVLWFTRALAVESKGRGMEVVTGHEDKMKPFARGAVEEK